MEMEKEALTNTIESDLARRNRNWDKIEQWINSRYQIVKGDVLAWALTCDEGITSFYATEPVSNLPNANPTYTLGFVLKSTGAASHVFIVDRTNGRVYKNTYNANSQVWVGWREISTTAV